jgi:ABC-2 type transport system ATP-binding protein
MSLTIKNIEKTYGQQKVLNDVSFNINDNEIVGFLGPNGAGKSTTMKIITGFLTPDNGDVFICGIDAKKNPIEAKRIIGYLPEHNPLYLDMYVKEYLDFASSFYKLGKLKNTAINNVIEQTGLQNEYKKKIRQLSKGYRQRVGLAQALIHNPRVLILDEPTTGLDPKQLIEIRDLIKNIGKEKTILFSTHILQEVESLCERAIVINQGKIVADGELSQIKSPTISAETIIVEFEQAFNFNWEQVSDKIQNVQEIGNNTYRISSSKDIRAELFNFAQQNELTLLTIQKETQKLESTFVDIIKNLQ